MAYQLLKILLLIYLTPLVTLNVLNDKDHPSPQVQARYDNYRIYYVTLENDEQVKVFQTVEERSDSYSFYGHARHPGQSLTIMVAAHKIAEMDDLLEAYKVKFEVLTENFQQKIDRQMKEDVLPKNTLPENFDWDHYFHLETIYAWMEKLAKDYDFVTTIDMGTSHKGIPIKGVKLAKNNENTAVFIESGIHAREWIAPATATYILNELLTSNDAEIQKIASNFNWIIFPVINPDGYKYTFEKDRMLRKNRNFFDIFWGVDLNRNYPFHWNETGSSPDPCRYDFAGPSAASETETQRLIEFIKKNVEPERIKTYLALHSFSELIMFPYGFTPEKVNNYDDLKSIGSKAAETIRLLTGEIYRSGSIYETIYPTSGGSKDWAYAVAKIPITYTFELRGPPNSFDLFILPATQIRNTGKEILGAFQTILNEADKLGYYTRN